MQINYKFWYNLEMDPVIKCHIYGKILENITKNSRKFVFLINDNNNNFKKYLK